MSRERDSEDPAVTAERWFHSMKGGILVDMTDRRPPIDLDRIAVLAKRNSDGADAWSPSRARERYIASISKRNGRPDLDVIAAEESGAFADRETYRHFTWSRFGVAFDAA